MSEVVRINGCPVHHPGHPDENVINRLEELLEMAKAGEITGIAYAIRFFDQACGDSYIGELDTKTVGALFKIMSRLSRDLDE